MPNSLSTKIGLKLGPIVLETFFKHYLNRASTSSDASERSSSRKQDLLWHEAFQVVKSVFRHTIEDFQEFGNARIPAPPWIYVEWTLIPISVCDIAAVHLIKAFGGEDVTKRVIGGTKWWQVRGIRGVECQWICQKSHLQKGRKAAKSMTANMKSAEHSSAQATNKPFVKLSKFGTYSDDGSISYMDGTRCMLYAHGGGYYFGSIDQERYVMQRYARKINGRVFAVNYRLAPQYPFPCALQDLLAAYIYLIDPPPGAQHAAIPSHLIVFGGDSAGAGLCLAALQIIRDSGLPAPAAAVLASPWCDLTHSFPSTIQNTATDIVPPYGLSLHKPSVLWPPPTDEVSSNVRKGLQERYGKAAKRTNRVENIASFQRDVNQDDEIIHSVETGMIHIHGHAVASENIVFNLDGETLQTRNPIQFYCPNNLLLHPLISPVLSYLGGLPPLMIIASDKEVLRDEMVYLAHKAAHPDRYPINEDAKKIYPPIRNPEMRPTFVHLQIYDDTAHVLPLFSFITPAKYCYRAITLFIKQFVIPEESPQPPIIPASPTITPEGETLKSEMSAQDAAALFPPQSPLSFTLGDAAHGAKTDTRNDSNDSGDIAGNRFKPAADQPQGPGTAGDPSVYARFNNVQRWPPDDAMIRERVSFQGVIRPLEPESEIPALLFPVEYIGVLLEPIARRYVESQALWEKKFAKATKRVASERKKNLELAEGEALHTVLNTTTHSSMSSILKKTRNVAQLKSDSEPGLHIRACSWALENERPPRSSIVSRRDTAEALHLAKVADLGVEPEESRFSGNRLWSVLVNFLTAHPNRKEMEEAKENDDDDDDDNDGGPRSGRVGKDRDNATTPQEHSDEQYFSKGSSIITRFRSLGKRQKDTQL
ncbi:lipase/ esterase [Hysterangium stoloniferum]|nr:lipase/ esterase [Hysterangium stoloniferum]